MSGRALLHACFYHVAARPTFSAERTSLTGGQDSEMQQFRFVEPQRRRRRRSSSSACCFTGEMERGERKWRTAVGRIVLTAGLCGARPLEGAINPGLSRPGCVSSPPKELILNAAEKRGGAGWEGGGVDHLIPPPDTRLLKPAPTKSVGTEKVAPTAGGARCVCVFTSPPQD